MRKKILNEKGFTLIEIIISLMLVGIIAVFAGMGIVSVAKGFLFTKTNAETVQKGQAAFTRLVKEFTVISSVTSGTSTSISFTSYKSALSEAHSVSWAGAGTDLLLDGDILTDNVSAFELAYYDSYDGPKELTWFSTRTIIEITLTLAGANNIDSVFAARVAPRNL